MNAVWKLVRVLRICNNRESSNPVAERVGIAFVGAILIVLMVGAGVLVGSSKELISSMLGGSDPAVPVFMTLYLIVAIATIFFAFIDMISSMFMSNDIEIIATMPLSSMQIALARFLSSLLFPLLMSIAIILPFTISYLIVSGFNLTILVNAIIAIFSLSITSTCLVGCILIIVMKLFRGIRNRSFLTTIGVVFSVILVIAITVFRSSSGDSEQLGQAVAQAVSVFSGGAWFLPHAGFLAQGIAGDWFGFIIGLLIVAALFVLFCLLAQLLYLNTALSMVNAGSSRKKVDAASLQKSNVSRKIIPSLMFKEYKTYVTNPSMITSWVFSTVGILILMAPGFASQGSTFSLIKPALLSSNIAIIICMAIFVGSGLAFFAINLSSAGTSAISREGSDIDFMKSIPVSYETQIIAKRNIAIILGAIGTFPYLLAGGIYLVVTSSFPFWMMIFPIASCAIVLFLMANMQVSSDLKKPNLHWTSPSVAVKSKPVFIILGVVLALVLLCIGPILFGMLGAFFGEHLIVIITCLFVALLVALAIISHHRMLSLASSRMEALEV